MYDYQNAIEKMILEILKFFKDNSELLDKNPVLKKRVEDLQALANELLKNKKIQETDFQGMTVQKKKAKAIIADIIYRLTGALRSFATDNGNDLLFKEVKKSETAIKRFKDVDVVSYSLFVFDKLTEYQKELEAYGVSADSTANLKTKTGEYKELLLLPAQMRKEVKTATKNIKKLITKILTLLRESIDNNMLQYEKTQVAAYDKYHRLREIDDSQTDHLSVYGTVLYEDTKEPVQEGAVTVIRMVDGKEVILLVVQTGEKGNYRCKVKEVGMVIMRFESPDCDTLDKKIRIYESKGVRLDVAIRKTE